MAIYIREDGSLALTESNKTLTGASRVKMIKRLAPEEEFREAFEGGMTSLEMAELFSINATTDISALKFLYGIKPGKRQHTVVQTLPISPEEIADKVVTIALEKLDSALDTRIKMIIARALHDAALSIEGVS